MHFERRKATRSARTWLADHFRLAFCDRRFGSIGSFASLKRTGIRSPVSASRTNLVEADMFRHQRGAIAMEIGAKGFWTRTVFR